LECLREIVCDLQKAWPVNLAKKPKPVRAPNELARLPSAGIALKPSPTKELESRQNKKSEYLRFESANPASPPTVTLSENPIVDRDPMRRRSQVSDVASPTAYMRRIPPFVLDIRTPA